MWQDETIYLKLRQLQLQQGQLELANQSYTKALQSRYLVNHKHKIIYCPIPKNACTFLKTMMIEQSDQLVKYQQSKQNIHQYLGRKDTSFRLTDLSCFHNPDYFKFAILRNPFKRLVSGYLDKIAKRTQPESFALAVIERVYQSLGEKTNLEKSITFKQFINYLVETEDIKLNEHWRPQSTFLGLGLFTFDFIGQFERLDLAISYLESKFKLKIPINVVQHHNQGNHITNYSNLHSNKTFEDTYPEELRQLDGFPAVEQFYTPELEALVKDRYAEDLEIYSSQFN